MRRERTWILIANAARARVLEVHGPSLRPVEGLCFETDLPPTHELVSDRQPRSYDSVGSARHAITSGVDPHRKEKRRFVEDIAQIMEEHVEHNAFDHLVVVAPPQALGDFRDAFPDSVRSRIVHEVAKDLTKTPNQDVSGHLGDLLFH